MRTLLYAAIVLVIMMAMPTRHASADPVTLSLSDGSFSVTGELIDYDGQNYQIDTDLGVLTLSQENTKCSGGACPSAAAITPVVHISGAAALGQLLLPSLIESFAKSREYEMSVDTDDDGVIVVEYRNPGAAAPLAIFRLKLTSTAQGIADMLFGKSQFVMARRALTPGERLAIESRFKTATGNPVRSVVMAWEDLRLFTSPDNPVQSLSVSNLMDMVDQAPAFWPEIEGVSEPVVLKGSFDSVSALRQQLGFDTATPILNQTFAQAKGLLNVSTSASNDLKQLRLRTSCFTTTDRFLGENPLKSPLFLFSTPNNLPPIARDFWTFLLTADAQNAVDNIGLISRTPTITRLHADNGHLIHAILNMDDEMRASDLQKAVQQLHEYGRLSLMFRFQDGTRILDEESTSNLRFLANLLKTDRFSEKQVLFAGFSDSQGSAAGNMQISLDRAQALRGTIRNLMGDQAPPVSRFRAIGFGEALPLVCNDTAWGQHQNRRVEIWVR